MLFSIGYNQVFTSTSSSTGNKTKALNPSGLLTPYSPRPHSNSGINTALLHNSIFS